MAYPLLGVQQALYALLNSDTTLQNLVGGVYDQAPTDAAYPFVAIETTNVSDWSFRGGEGVQAQFELQVYSRYHGMSECHSILARLDALLHEANLVVSGVNVVQMRIDSARASGLNDGRTTRGTLQLDVWAYEQE